MREQAETPQERHQRLAREAMGELAKLLNEVESESHWGEFAVRGETSAGQITGLRIEKIRTSR